MGFFSKQHSSRIINQNVIAYTGGQTAIATGNFGNETFQVRVLSTIGGWIHIDNGIAAVSNADTLLLANQAPEYFACTPGQSLSFNSTSTSSGYVSVSEVS
jgi:hypothetical protein